MKQWIRFLIAVVVFGVCLSDTSEAAKRHTLLDEAAPSGGASSVISGTVKNGHGRLVGGAEVRIFRRSGGGRGKLVAKGKTTAAGTFAFQQPAGQYRIVTRHAGEGRSILFIQTRANQTFNLLVSISPPLWYWHHERFFLGRFHRA